MLHHYLIHSLITAIAVLIAARIVPGIRVKSFGSAVVFGLVLGLLDKFVGTIITGLALPLIFLTLGLFLLVINGFLFWLADKLVDGVEADGFGACVLGSLVTTVIGWAFQLVLHL
jgi:putative membrane protein